VRTGLSPSTTGRQFTEKMKPISGSAGADTRDPFGHHLPRLVLCGEGLKSSRDGHTARVLR